MQQGAARLRSVRNRTEQREHAVEQVAAETDEAIEREAHARRLQALDAEAAALTAEQAATAAKSRADKTDTAIRTLAQRPQAFVSSSTLTRYAKRIMLDRAGQEAVDRERQRLRVWKKRTRKRTDDERGDRRRRCCRRATWPRIPLPRWPMRSGSL